jgi:hypothetical protein
MVLFILWFEEVIENNPQIISQFIPISYLRVFQNKIHVDPYFLSNTPKPINHLQIPFGLRPLTQLIPKTIVILNASHILILTAEHLSRQVLVLNLWGYCHLLEELLELWEISPDYQQLWLGWMMLLLQLIQTHEHSFANVLIDITFSFFLHNILIIYLLTFLLLHFFLLLNFHLILIRHFFIILILSYFLNLAINRPKQPYFELFYRIIELLF